VEFVEITGEERGGALEGALAAYQAQAEYNLGVLRGLLKVRKGGLRKMMADFSVKALRKLLGTNAGGKAGKLAVGPIGGGNSDGIFFLV
jgi:hypothetical protein